MILALIGVGLVLVGGWFISPMMQSGYYTNMQPMNPLINILLYAGIVTIVVGVVI